MHFFLFPLNFKQVQLHLHVAFKCYQSKPCKRPRVLKAYSRSDQFRRTHGLFYDPDCFSTKDHRVPWRQKFIKSSADKR